MGSSVSGREGLLIRARTMAVCCSQLGVTPTRVQPAHPRHVKNPSNAGRIGGGLRSIAMIKTLLTMVLALELGTGFGAASAELISTTGNAMEIELRVEIRQSAEAVVAHLAFEDETPITFPLTQRESGVFGIRTEVTKVNYRVVFEIVGSGAARSDSYSLMELGLVFPAGTTNSTTPDPSPGLSDATRGWGWLALALGAAALSLLAFWALGGKGEHDHASSETSAPED